MEATDLIGLLVIGFAAGVVSGLVGVGGGVLFVPGLVLFMDEVQVKAEATSLFAVIVVAAVGAYRQRGYGNLRLRDGLVVGLLSPVGVAVGTVVANELSERALQIAFAAFQLFVAYRLARRAMASPEEAPAGG
jgi:uncharacterized membrane protein YfcA